MLVPFIIKSLNWTNLILILIKMGGYWPLSVFFFRFLLTYTLSLQLIKVRKRNWPTLNPLLSRPIK